MHLCETCGRIYKSQHGLELHIKLKHWHITYRCKACNRSYSRQTTLNKHKQKMHPTSSHHCAPRNVYFIDTDALKHHEQQHVNSVESQTVLEEGSKQPKVVQHEIKTPDPEDYEKQQDSSFIVLSQCLKELKKMQQGLFRQT